MARNIHLPKVTVIICSHNGEKRISDALSAIKEQNYPKELLDVVVIDDGSTDSTSSVAKRFFSKVYKNEVNLGLARSRNLGLNVAKGDIVLFTDDDCVPDKMWVKNIVEVFLKNKEVVGVGGSILPFDKKENWLSFYAEENKSPIYTHIRFVSPTLRAIFYLKKLFFPIQMKLKDGQRISSIMGANSAYRKKCLQSVGGMDELLRRGQDFDFSIRVQKFGKLVFCEHAKVVHKHRATLKDFIRHLFINGAGLAKIAKKHPRLLILPYPWPFLFLMLLAVSFFFGFFLFYSAVLLYLIVESAYWIRVFFETRRFVSLLLPVIDFLRELSFDAGFVWGFFK